MKRLELEKISDWRPPMGKLENLFKISASNSETVFKG